VSVLYVVVRIVAALGGATLVVLALAWLFARSLGLR
jgi:hypothetical protein